MPNFGQYLRHAVSFPIFRKKNRVRENSITKGSFSGPSETISGIITSSKVSISKLQQELEFSLSTLDQLSQELSPGAVVNHQQNSSLDNYPTTEILFYPAGSRTNTQFESTLLDLSEISITPVSQESEKDTHELEQILITPL